MNININTNNDDAMNKNPIHTLILCRHGDSIWNGGQPGTQETFTGWTDVPLSEKGVKEAMNTGSLVASTLSCSGSGSGSSGDGAGIDACFTSILGRAKQTAHYTMWAFSEQPSSSTTGTISSTHAMQYVSDYRLNERHYGALQGYVKIDVENNNLGLGYTPEQVNQWRRNWYAVPPLLDDDDPRRIEEIRKYKHYCHGIIDNIPKGESLDMVANNRIRPFLDDVLSPIMDEAVSRRRQMYQQQHQKKEKQQEKQLHDDDDDDDDGGGDNNNHNDSKHKNCNDGGGTGLIIAHANSLRALIGVICQVENDETALQKLESMKIQTGVPLVMQYRRTNDGGYEPYTSASGSTSDSAGVTTATDVGRITPDLPVFPLSSIPKRNSQENFVASERYRYTCRYGSKRNNKRSKIIRIDVI